ncbi:MULTISPECIES: Ivy family c-type lysozyme inhibitor [Citrobacter]|uniref:Ivy family c-type lysozyme inhibitor n=1 Tax=Citrobacter TaxID=544 RepID=UPI0005368755|nr:MULTISPECIES: Ivy family c-type lysozyme inhibitor [Citrobacter]MCK7564158.1 Ivy family c-type lysozyme inhibitor [Citrobacter koseri]MDM2950395.1 Ivy family c-type lysozyme inhibitor [Citrobacter sp. CK203]MDM9068252.1 Ivy family c-type lysozyme inhibitor [Citrobacter koseri]MDM9081783.1 Ivy family c-type lysozyme inhibitor [Citrobacter koseri]MDM9092426.1 Ivy family c-type lysozyme inhibitor [Citrobacter koseri]
MKKKLMIVALALLPFTVSAEGNPYLFDFVQGKETGGAYKTLIARHNLPSWVKDGGTSTPANEITIDGRKYLALSGCKPHNCPAQSIAILYSVDKGDIHGVFSEYDITSEQQKLTWLNLEPTGSDVMRNILFARLNGDVSN